MKNGFKYLIGAFVVAATTLTACGRSGNGGNNSSALGSCVYDAQGNCVTGTGSAGYVGDGNWSGRLIIQNGFQQFAQENGLCYGNCMMLSGYVQLQLQVQLQLEVQLQLGAERDPVGALSECHAAPRC